MVTQKKQHLIYTAVPRGFTDDKQFLRVGVRIGIRLSYAEGTGAVLEDFKDFLRWPVGGFWWSATFDGGATWEPAAEERWTSDGGFWEAAFHEDLPVTSVTKAPPPKRAVFGYPYRALARDLPTFHLAETFDETSLGSRLRPYVFPRLGLPKPPDADAVPKFMAFHAPAPTTVAPPRGHIDPDFHQRVSLLADHGPVMTRLGLVLELLFPVRDTKIDKIAVRTNWEGDPPTTLPTEHASPFTLANHVPGLAFAAATSSPDMDTLLRLNLFDEDRFSVHSIDVDASIVAAFGTQGAPPPPTSSGFVIARAETAAKVQASIDRGIDSRKAISIAPIDAVPGAPGVGRIRQAQMPELDADHLIQGYLLEVRRIDPASAGGPQPWRGLGHREVTYTAYGTNGEDISFTARSEAPIINGIRISEDPARPGLETSDVLARWDGWSLAVPRPGIYQLQADASTGEVVDSAGTFDNGSVYMETDLPDGSAYQMPALRFGKTYQFRARAVDVTGFAHGWQGAPSSPQVPYFRFEPVSAPVALPPPDAYLIRTESSLRMVLRTAPVAPYNHSTSRTIVPARSSVEMALTHGMFDQGAAPDPALYELIAGLDEHVLPDTGPPPQDAAGTPAPLTVAWLPDPMSTAVGVELVNDDRTTPLTVASFLPPGSDVLGRGPLGAWQSVAIRLVAVDTPDQAGIKTVIEADGHRIIPVGLSAGQQRTLLVRGLPPQQRFGEHGILDWLGDDLDLEEVVLKKGFSKLCPPLALTLVHAWPYPLSKPAPGENWEDEGDPIDIFRDSNEKDAHVRAFVRNSEETTGRITVYASWTDWQDDGPGFPRNPAPHEVAIKQTAVDDQATPATPRSGFQTLRLAAPLVFPDFRRRDVTLSATAVGRYLEEFRETLADAGFSNVDGTRLLNLPAGVEVESVRLLRNGRDLVRSKDYRLVSDNRKGRPPRTLALSEGVSPSGITVLGVRQKVTESDELRKVVVPAAMRPLPPVVKYVLPAFQVGEGKLNQLSGESTATRGSSRIRIWLERPWWSSGREEKLAVIFNMVPAPPQDDSDHLSKLVTRFAQDPVLLEKNRMLPSLAMIQQPLTGAIAPDSITLDEDVPGQSPSVFAQLHDVAYDADRDMYYAEVGWPEQPHGTFVRPAIARYQEHVTEGHSRLSRIRTIDPIRLLPSRKVRAWMASATKIRVEVTTMTGAAPKPPPGSRVTVTVQRQNYAGDADLGWERVSEAFQGHGELNDETGEYEISLLDRPKGKGPFRLVVEEVEWFETFDPKGNLPDLGGDGPEVTPNDASRELIGERPVLIATLPLPEVRIVT